MVSIPLGRDSKLRGQYAATLATGELVSKAFEGVGAVNRPLRNADLGFMCNGRQCCKYMLK